MNPKIRKLMGEKQKCAAEVAKLESSVVLTGKALTENEAEQLELLKWRSGLLTDQIARATADAEAIRADPHDYNELRDFQIQPPRVRPAARTASGLTGGQAWAASKFDLTQAGASGFGDMSEFIGVVGSGLMDNRLTVMTGQTEGSGAGGGFAVPDELLVEPLGVAYEESVCMPRCDLHAMTTQTKKIAGWDASSASGGTYFGGFTPQILAEAEDMTLQTGALRSITLEARKIGLLAKSSNELIDDAGTIPQLMASGLGTAIAHTVDYFLIQGTGAGQPLGCMNATSRITVSKEANQAATTIVYANIAKMYARLHPACHKNAVWLASPTAIPSLETLSIPVGTSGAVYRVLSDSSGRPEMMHVPVVFTEKVAALGTEGDLILADFSQYALGMRKDVSIEQSRHVYFASDETAWRAIMRMDGMPKWSAVYTPRAGDTLSWCVTLQTRS